MRGDVAGALGRDVLAEMGGERGEGGEGGGAVVPSAEEEGGGGVHRGERSEPKASELVSQGRVSGRAGERVGERATVGGEGAGGGGVGERWEWASVGRGRWEWLRSEEGRTEMWVVGSMREPEGKPGAGLGGRRAAGVSRECDSTWSLLSILRQFAAR